MTTVSRRVHDLELQWDALYKVGEPVRYGVFTDLFRGELQKGDTILKVAIKRIRVLVQSNDEHRKARVYTTSKQD